MINVVVGEDSGTVDGMTSNEGFFELKSKDNLKLKTVLDSHPAVKNIDIEDDKLFVYLKKALEPEDLNQYLFNNHVWLQHLVKRKHSLEEQFLELTANK